MSGWISVVGWDRFQHYKDRDPPWVKLYRDLLTTESWVLGTDCSRLVQVASVLLAARYENKIPYRWSLIKKVASLDCSEKEFNSALQHLVEHNFLQTQKLTKAEKSPSQDASDALAKCASETETETETETEQSREEADKTPIPPRGAGADPKLHEQIVATYHEILPELPAVRDWPERRRRKLEARIAERVRAGKPADKPEYWRALFAQVHASDFLCGRKSDWRCPGLEWLLEPKNFTKVIEGAYRNHDGMNGAHHAR
jgi:hypothetical protein